MLNHTYTSVKNANLVDCGKKQHISSQPSPLLRDNYLGEYRTDLDKKKVLSNLGIVTDLTLEWEYIKGDIGRNETLMQELDSRTKYVSSIDNLQRTVIEGIKYLENVSKQEGEELQNTRLTELENKAKELNDGLQELKDYISNTVDGNLEELSNKVDEVSDKLNNITQLIQVSEQEGNALILIPDSGLYVPDLSKTLEEATTNLEGLQKNVNDIQESLDQFVTKEDLGEDFDFVTKTEFNPQVTRISNIENELKQTIKTDSNGSVNNLSVNQLDSSNSSIYIQKPFNNVSGQPLDVYAIRETLDDLLALSIDVCYPGMVVVVNQLSSTYILREPQEGVEFNQEYVSTLHNWKSPEDLVTVALTKQEYEALEAIDPNVFYYIYEDEIVRTKEPKREDFSTEELFNEAWQEWVESLKTLSQEYMSAAWGVEIENKVSDKVTNEKFDLLTLNVVNLSNRVDTLVGGEEGVSLANLDERVSENESVIEQIVNEDIVNLQASIEEVSKNVNDNYVTKESITDENSQEEYIFLKKQAFSEYVSETEDKLAQQVITEEISTKTINIDGISITSDATYMIVNGKRVALNEQIPVIQVMPITDYNNLVEKQEDVYYYTYDDEDSYVLNSDWTNYKSQQSEVLTSLASQVESNKNHIGVLDNLNTVAKSDLVSVINELVSTIQTLNLEIQSIRTKINGSELDQ